MPAILEAQHREKPHGRWKVAPEDICRFYAENPGGQSQTRMLITDDKVHIVELVLGHTGIHSRHRLSVQSSAELPVLSIQGKLCPPDKPGLRLTISKNIRVIGIRLTREDAAKLTAST